jgi:hypothetical protein
MHTRYRPHPRFAFILLFFALFIGGCAKNADPISGPDTPAATGGSISDEARKASLDTLSAFFNSLPGDDPAADRQTVLKFLKTRPEFEATGMSPDGGNVWARFVDGRLALFVNNRTPDSIIVNPRVDGVGIQRQNNRVKKTADGFPSSSSARILNSLGPGFPYAQRTVDSLRIWCSLAGYTLSTPDVATIEKLKSMDGDGIFYWATHGGYAENRDGSESTVFSMYTADVVTLQNEIKYVSDLNTFHVVYIHAPEALHDRGFVRGAGRFDGEWHYGVDLSFIGANLSFANNSLVYFDACNSGGIDKARSQPLMAKAGFYLGWTVMVDDKFADVAARFFFDRALGMNRNDPKVSPPQRPFFIGDVLADMTRRGLDWDPRDQTRLVHPFEPVLTTLRLLAPSIGYTSGPADVSSNSYSIGGDFADDPGADGEALLNGKPLTIIKWTKGEVTVQKPDAGGELVVRVRKIRSNPVRLTEWHGTFDYTYTGQGSLKQHIVINVGFLADVHSYRPNILASSMYMPFAGLGRSVMWLKTTTCTYECSGEYRDNSGVLQESWQGSGTLPMVDLGSTATGFSAYAMIDSAGTSSPLNLIVNGTFTRTTKDGGSSAQPLNLTTSSIVLKHSMPDFVMKAGSASLSGGTMTWKDMTAAFPPDPKGAQ